MRRTRKYLRFSLLRLLLVLSLERVFLNLNVISLGLLLLRLYWQYVKDLLADLVHLLTLHLFCLLRSGSQEIEYIYRLGLLLRSRLTRSGTKVKIKIGLLDRFNSFLRLRLLLDLRGCLSWARVL